MNNGDMPASPLSTEELSDRHAEGIELFTGLTKREEFAKAAMQGILAREGVEDWAMSSMAERAVVAADALLAALEADDG